MGGTWKPPQQSYYLEDNRTLRFRFTQLPTSNKYHVKQSKTGSPQAVSPVVLGPLGDHRSAATDHYAQSQYRQFSTLFLPSVRRLLTHFESSTPDQVIIMPMTLQVTGLLAFSLFFIKQFKLLNLFLTSCLLLSNQQGIERRMILEFDLTLKSSLGHVTGSPLVLFSRQEHAALMTTALGFDEENKKKQENAFVCTFKELWSKSL